MYNNTPSSDKCLNKSDNIYVEDNSNLYVNQNNPQIGINQNYIYEDYQKPDNKLVPPPYHIARNYSKHAKYYDVLHSKTVNDGKNNEFGDFVINNTGNHSKIFDQPNSDSPVSLIRSQVETPLSNVDDDRYSIKNFVDNQTQKPFIIKPKAHKLTTEHGDYHFLIQNKFDIESNANNVPVVEVSNTFNEQPEFVPNNEIKIAHDRSNLKPKISWMFGQHKNVKVVR